MSRFLPEIRQPLSWRLPHKPGETAASFASRLAALNGRAFSTFMGDMDLSRRGLDLGDEDIVKAIAALGAADPDELLRTTPRKMADKKYQTFCGQKFARLSVRRTIFAYCPHCLLEDYQRSDQIVPRSARSWLRMEWNVVHFRSCMTHETELFVASPERRQFQIFDFCGTVDDLYPELEAEARNARKVPRSPYQKWLYARLMNVAHPRRDTPSRTCSNSSFVHNVRKLP